MEFAKTVYARRSVREFTGDTIPQEQIIKILEAGLRAPNACNYQSWHFYCITGKENIESVYPDLYRGEWIKKAAFVVIITENGERLAPRWGESKGTMFLHEDAGAAAENMLLCAADMGYNGCFIGAFDENNVTKYLQLSENEHPCVMLPIGVTAAEVPLRERKPFDECVTFIG